MATKLLYVVNNADFLISHRIHLLVAAKAEGYEVFIACPPGNSASQLKMQGFHVYDWSLSRKGINPIMEISAIVSLYRIYREIQADIVHHITIKPVIYGSLAARLARVPKVINAISGLGTAYIGNTWSRRLLRRVTNYGYTLAGRHLHSCFIFQNKEDQHYFVENKLITLQQSVIIPGSGVCMQHFTPLAFPMDDPFTVVLPARLLADKGVHEFVASARILKQYGIRCALVGDIDPDNATSLGYAQLRAWVEAGDVEFWGYQKDIREVFARAHLVCLPSYREGCPRVLIEAAACARPIVTTDAPGCRDLVIPGENGYLVPIKSIAELAQAILKVYQNQENLARYGMNSRVLVEKAYSTQAVIEKTFIHYQGLETAFAGYK